MFVDKWIPAKFVALILLIYAFSFALSRIARGLDAPSTQNIGICTLLALLTVMLTLHLLGPKRAKD